MPALVAPHSHQLDAADGTPLHVTDYLLPVHAAHSSVSAPALSIPTLILVAGEDHLVEVEGSMRFFERLPAGLAQYKLYDSFYHELLSEVDAAKPLADLKSWLEA